jgi:transmembrane sensor
MNQEISRDTLFDYYAGNASLHQKRQIEIWLNSSYRNQELFFQWLEEWERQNSKYEFDVKGDFHILKERIIQAEQSDNQHNFRPGTVKKADHFFQGWIRMAAVFVLLLVATVTYYFIQPQQNFKTYHTGFGEIRTITLPDHSSVKLNANSRLKILNNWASGDAREVMLEGEAFFSVTHTENNQKFIVHSNDLEVEVLGTEFNVNSRNETTRVVLASGKVKLSLKADKGKENLIMAPGELVEYTQGGLKKEKVNPQLHTSWRNNKLIFEKAPVHEVIQLLKDNHGLEVVLEDTGLQDQTFTATLPADDVGVLLKALSKSFELDLMREGDQVILKSDK